jgi:hypothetical protein
MTEIIARREYTFTVENRVTPVVVQLGKPALFPDPPYHGDWYCPWTIEGTDGLREHYAGGVDGLQALLLAISGVRIDLDDLAHRGRLTWLDHEDLGIALVGPAA